MTELHYSSHTTHHTLLILLQLAYMLSLSIYLSHRMMGHAVVSSMVVGGVPVVIDLQYRTQWLEHIQNTENIHAVEQVE